MLRWFVVVQFGMAQFRIAHSLGGFDEIISNCGQFGGQGSGIEMEANKLCFASMMFWDVIIPLCGLLMGTALHSNKTVLEV